MTKAKRRITKFDFSGDESHVALVDSAANGRDTLIMKSENLDESLQDESVNLNPDKEITKMAKEIEAKEVNLEELLKSDLGLDIKKAIAAEVGKAKLAGEKALEKANELAEETLAKAKEEATLLAKAHQTELLKGYVRKAVNYSHFGVEDTQTFAKAMLAVNGVEGGKLVLEALEKAALQQVDHLDLLELGVTIDEDIAEESNLMKALKAQTK